MKKSLVEQLALRLEQGHFFEHGAVLAVSGGADSVALLSLIACIADEQNATHRIVAAHLNHALRGQESDGDERFVTALAERLGIRVLTHRLPAKTVSRDPGGSLEAALRQRRYEFLRKTAESLGFRYVATAHTADDQVETVLHRILRGTGIAGLGGMAEARPLSEAVVLLRPLLDIRGEQLRAYLAEIGQDFRRDSSNADMVFMRNRLRHQLLPLIHETVNERADEAVLRLAEQARRVEAMLASLVDALESRCLWGNQSGCECIDLEQLRPESDELILRLLQRIWQRNHWPLREMGAEQWQKLLALVRCPSESKRETRWQKLAFFPGRILVERCENNMRLSQE